MRRESRRPGPASIGGWFHGGDASRGAWRDALPPPPPTPIRTTPAITAEQRDQVFRAWIACAPLTAAHTKHLRARGFTPEQIAANGYATHPPGRLQRREIASALLAHFGAPIMEQIPGFYYREERHGERYPMLAGPAGILIPAQDAAGRIQAFQSRSDDPDSDPQSRYKWVSSLNRAGGTGSGAPMHVAYAAGDGPGEPIDYALLTEGALKASLSAATLGITTMALPGVSAQRDLPATITALNPTSVGIAFDADAATNAHVLRDRDRAATPVAALGCAVQLVTWDTQPGPDGTPTPKGVDDAIRAGVPMTTTPYPFPYHSGRIAEILAAAMPKIAPRAVRHINEARAELGRELEEALADLGTSRPQAVQVRAATGVGKTRCITDLLTAWNRDGWPTKPSHALGAVPMADPVRVIILGVTTEACMEIEAALPPGLAIRQEGRNPDPTHRWGCLEPERTHSAGANRHNPTADVCVICAENNGWPKGHPACGYLRSKQAVDHARVVIAPASSYFNGSSGLDAFDLIVFDEGLFPFLVEEIVVTADRCAQWRTRMNEIDATPPAPPSVPWEAVPSSPPRYPVGNPFRQLIDALDMLQAHRPLGPQDWLPAMPRLREVCPTIATIVRAVRSIAPATGSDRYPCETPRLWEDRGQQLVPLRALRDLADAIHDELSRDEQADTRLWLTASGFVLLRPRQAILDILRERKVINLDATPHDALRFFLPEATIITVDAPAHQRIVQITDFLGTPRELAGIGHANLSRVQAAVDAIVATETPASPVIFGRKSIMPGGAQPDALTITADHPGVQYGWFDNHTRGLNKYQDTDLLVIIGRHSPPIDRIRAEVMAARFAPTPAPRGSHRELLRYDWRGPDGNGKGRFTTADNDPDVNAAIRQAERASILQAIGRGRAVNRSPDDPLRVYLLSSLPISNLPIDELTTLVGLGSRPRRRGTNTAFRAAQERRQNHNAAAASETERAVARAIIALRHRNEPVTPSSVSRESSIRRQTLYETPALRRLIEQSHDQLRSITRPVPPGTHRELSLCVPGGTGSVIAETGGEGDVDEAWTGPPQPITKPVPPGTDRDLSLSVPDPTLSIIQQEPPTVMGARLAHPAGERLPHSPPLPSSPVAGA